VQHRLTSEVLLFGIEKRLVQLLFEGKAKALLPFYFQPLLWPDVGESPPAPSFMIVFTVL